MERRSHWKSHPAGTRLERDHLTRTHPAGTHLAVVLVAFCCLAAPAYAGVSVSIYPSPICAELEEVFTAYVWVDSAGSEFDGYETVIRFDPSMLSFVSVQEESLMIDPPGGTWWRTEIGDSTVFISHVLLSGGVGITGPGALSSITFQAPADTGQTEISFDYIEFYRAGQYVPDIVWHDGTVLIREDCSLQAACCFEDGSCQIMTVDECVTASGIWHGEWDSCDPNPCPQPGVCCVMEACHIVISEQECTDIGGSWHPEWNSCDPNPCLVMSAPTYPEVEGTVLFPARPNPSMGGMIFGYHLAAAGSLQIDLFDPAGRRVRQLYRGRANAGIGAVQWDGLDQAGLPVEPGAYFCRLSSSGKVRTQRFLVLE